MKKEITAMKKNAIIYIDDTHAQVTKAFEKQARIFGTPEYREWRAYRQDFPNAQMVSKTEYICLQENADELMKEFEAQKKISIVQKSPYRTVLNWFLATFPELTEDGTEATAAEEVAAEQNEALIMEQSA